MGMFERLPVYLLFFLLASAAVLILRWVIDDARRRNTHPVIAALVWIALFPLGTIAWLVFRPPVAERH